jgi:hypothetical protein
LANTFTRMLEMVANACSRSQRLGTEEVLALYQRWMQTRDPVIEKQLQAIGIDVSNGSQMQ